MVIERGEVHCGRLSRRISMFKWSELVVVYWFVMVCWVGSCGVLSGLFVLEVVVVSDGGG